MTSDNDDNDNDEDDDNAEGMKPSTSSRQSKGKKPPTSGPLGKAVEQIDLETGKMIARFDSQSAAERETGTAQGTINKCVRGERKSAGGFGWRSAGESSGGAGSGGAAAAGKVVTSKKPSTSSTQTIDKKAHLISERSKLVQQYNLTTGKRIADFGSEIDAEKSTGINKNIICRFLGDKKGSGGGFGWKFVVAAAAAAVVAPSQRESRDGNAREPVEQFDVVTRGTIRQFTSLQAAATATNVYHQLIYDCIHGKKESAGNFGWRRPGSGGAAAAASSSSGALAMSCNDSSDNHDEDNKAGGKKPSSTSSSQLTVKKSRASRAGKPVEQYDFDTGEMTAVVDTSSDEERTLGISTSSISACINGERECTEELGWRRPIEAEAVRVAKTSGCGDEDHNAGGKKPSSSSSQSTGKKPHANGSPPQLDFENSNSPYQSRFEEEEGDDEEEEEGEDNTEEDDEQEEDEGDDTLLAAAAAALFPASHDIPRVPTSAITSSSSSSSSSSSCSKNAPLPIITAHQRSVLQEAIYDRIFNHTYRTLTIAEKTARFVEFFQIAKDIEIVFYEDHHPDEYLELLKYPRTRLFEKLECPSIKALYPRLKDSCTL